jgi:hypothetical protein
VLQPASAVLDEVRRQEFFRAGPVMRRHGRGKRWLLLHRWKTVRGSKRAELRSETVRRGLIRDPSVNSHGRDRANAGYPQGRYVPMDQMCLSPQCGFSSTVEGNQITEAEQWASWS